MKVRTCKNRMFVYGINLNTIRLSGQCFRIKLNLLENNSFTILSKDKLCYGKQYDKGVLITTNSVDDIPYWKNYFDTRTNYNKFNQSILNSKDKFLIKSVEFGKGMCILKQDIWETLITFIISQWNSIERITKLVEQLCSRFGHKIGNGYYSFPNEHELAKATLDELKELGLGYRAEYIYNNAQFFSENDINEYFRFDKYNQLLTCSGIGPKVANCIMLFAFHDLSAFPIDKWIQEIIDVVYDGYFDELQYDGFQGFVQQYMFYYYRSMNKSKTEIKIKERNHKLF